MLRFHKILVIIDKNDNAQPGLVRALQMHHEPGTEVKLFTNIYDSAIESSFMLDPENLDTVKQSMIDYQTKKLEQLAIESKTKHVTFSVSVVWQESDYISDLHMVDVYQPDLLIKSCRQASGVAHWFFNSNSSQLLKTCPCPILFVKNELLTANRSVIAAIDPAHKLSQSSKLDYNVLAAGHAIAAKLKAPLHACHCFDPSYWEVFLHALKGADVWTDVFPANPDSDNQHVLDELKQQQYDKFTAACSVMVPHTQSQHFLNGSIADELPKLASKLQASIVVLGTNYRSGLLGSSAEAILNTVEIDVLVVKPDGFESQLP